VAVGLFGQLGGDAADRIAHVVGGGVEVAVQLERDVIREAPSRDEELTRSMPSMPATWRSITSVIRSSITSAEAPR
jgi:hypothetical protein